MVDTSAITSALRTALKLNSTIRANVDAVEMGIKDIPTKICEIWIRIDDITVDGIQTFGYTRYHIPVVIDILQKGVKPSRSEVSIDVIVNAILSVINSNRNLSGSVNGIVSVDVAKDRPDEEMRYRESNIEIIYEIME